MTLCIDQTLMPLGQALKSHVKNSEAFFMLFDI